jgi:hypothetical protein
VTDDERLDDDDDLPWASPEIQKRYEAALGRFMLAFNRVDNLLSEVVEAVLRRAGRMDLIKPCIGKDFWLRLLTLDLLKSSVYGKGIADVPVDLIRCVANHRNKLAHGHFDQNPFSGEYDIVGKNVRATYSAEDLDCLTAKATDAWSALRGSEAFYEFDEHPLPSE